jgi:hypothetical protein
MLKLVQSKSYKLESGKKISNPLVEGGLYTAPTIGQRSPL